MLNYTRNDAGIFGPFIQIQNGLKSSFVIKSGVDLLTPYKPFQRYVGEGGGAAKSGTKSLIFIDNIDWTP